MTAPIGARLEDWVHFDEWLGLGEDLLPVVPDANAQRTPLSKVKKFGKIPSLYNSEGQAYGIADWTTLSINEGNVAHWRADRRYSMCLRLGPHSGCYAIDVDVDDFDLAEEIHQIVESHREPSGEPLPVRSRDGTCKFLLLFRLSRPVVKTIIDWDRKDANGKPERIEILGDGQQCVVAGSHPSGTLYTWNDQDGLPWSIPMLTNEELDAIIIALSERFGTSASTRGVTASGSAPGVARSVPDAEVLSVIGEAELADLEDALRYQPLVDAAASNDVWSAIGYALLSTDLEQQWLDFSARAPNQTDADDPSTWWEAHRHQQPRSDFRHIFSLARSLGWRLRSAPASFEIVPVANAAATTARAAAAPAMPVMDTQVPLAHFLCTDLANARRIVMAFGRKLAIVAGTFYGYTGTHWEKDEAGAARCIAQLSAIIHAEADAHFEQFKTLAATEGYEELVRAYQDVDPVRRAQSKARTNLAATELGPRIIKALSASEELRKWSKHSESAGAQNAAIKLLRSMLQTPIDKLDTHHHLLNCLNGTVDLRTGELHEHNSDDWITQLAPTRYDPAAACPAFEQFLLDVLDPDRAAFIQRWFGYCATGETREQKIVLHIGPGGNGKGTLFRAITVALGSYVHTAAPHILTGDAGSSRHPTEIADLFGRRFVVSHESDEGAILREGFMKQASGEDQLSGRFLFKDFFAFTPTFKLQLLTNHKPTVKGQDFGVWRRLLLLNYGVRYGSVQQVKTGEADRVGDEGLTTRLVAEREGILAWLVRGAMDWYRAGLNAPASVFEDSEAYRDEQDRVRQFVAERCIIDPAAWSAFGGPFGLYPEYTRWAKDSGFNALAITRFNAELGRVIGPTFRKETKNMKVDNKWKIQKGCYGVTINIDQDGGGYVESGVEDLV